MPFVRQAGRITGFTGAHVVVFTTSPGKTEDALRLGTDEVVVSRNGDEKSGW